MLYAFLFLYEHILESPCWEPSAQGLVLQKLPYQAHVTWKRLLNMLLLPRAGVW